MENWPNKESDRLECTGVGPGTVQANSPQKGFIFCPPAPFGNGRIKNWWWKRWEGDGEIQPPMLWATFPARGVNAHSENALKQGKGFASQVNAVLSNQNTHSSPALRSHPQRASLWEFLNLMCVIYRLTCMKTFQEDVYLGQRPTHNECWAIVEEQHTVLAGKGWLMNQLVLLQEPEVAAASQLGGWGKKTEWSGLPQLQRVEQRMEVAKMADWWTVLPLWANVIAWPGGCKWRSAMAGRGQYLASWDTIAGSTRRVGRSKNAQTRICFVIYSANPRLMRQYDCKAQSKGLLSPLNQVYNYVISGSFCIYVSILIS